MLNVCLKVVGGELEAKEIALTLPATVGRGREAEVHLPHPLVSRQHCELFERSGSVLVRDLDSLNGTFVGSERIDEAVLNPGDLLTVGTVTFRAAYEPSDRNVARDAELDETLVAKTSGPSVVNLSPAGPDADTEDAPQHGSTQQRAPRQIRIDDVPHQSGITSATPASKPIPGEPV